MLLISFSASLFYVLGGLGCLTQAFGKMASVLLGWGGGVFLVFGGFFVCWFGVVFGFFGVLFLFFFS